MNQIDNDYSRSNLIAICEAAVVPVEAWRNRDTPGAQEQLGKAWMLLKAGCKFHIHPPSEKSGCFTDERTIWLTIDWPSFNTFEYGGDVDYNSDTFYLPTPKRLRERQGTDWY